MTTIFCENINRKIQVSENGINLCAALLAEGIRVFKCGNYWPFNHCRSDLIEVIAGSENLSPITGKERAKLSSYPGSFRLAGQCRVQGDVTIRVRPLLKETED